MAMDIPAPKFKHFERVVVTGDDERCKDCRGEVGTIICLESSAVRKNSDQPERWLYVVHLPAISTYRSFFQSDLTPVGCVAPESDYFGGRPEISFDIVLDEDNDWIEGTYRLSGEFWKVVIFKKDDVPKIKFEPTSWEGATPWERGITGMVIHFPRGARMGRQDLIKAMSQILGFNDWLLTQGPDSMMLR